MPRLLVLVVLASILGYAPAAPVPKGAAKLPWKFPTQIGTEWEYEVSGSQETRTTGTITEVGKQGDDQTIRIRTTCECVIQGMEVNYISATRLIVRDGYLWEMMADTPKFPLLKLLPNVGDTWERKHTNLAYDRTVIRVVAEEKVKVPAGTFDCVQVETKAYDGDNLEWTETNWYASGVGLVKSTGGPTEERVKVLKKFTLGEDPNRERSPSPAPRPKAVP